MSGPRRSSPRGTAVPRGRAHLTARCRAALVGVTLVMLGAACGSTTATVGRETTTTTVGRELAAPTSVETNGSMAEYLQGPGQALVEIERAMQPLAQGVRPPRQACQQVRADLATTFADRGRVSQLLESAPDPELAELIRRDLANKAFLLDACLSTSGLNDSPAELREFARIERVTRTLERALGAVGVSLATAN